MLKIFNTAYIILFVIAIVGCGVTGGKSIVAKQDWSENYAKVKGVEATSPLMVDGDPSTIADTQLPTDLSAGATRFTEAVIKLPETKKIRKIVVQSTNLRSFSVYAGGTNGPDDWKTLKEFKNIEDSKISMNVSADTDRIKIRVLRTSDDTTQPGSAGAQARLKRAPGKIKEIELYGLVEEGEIQPKTTTPSPTGIISPTTASSPTSTTEAPAPEVPKGPPVSASVEIDQNAYPIAGPIPLKVNIKAGADEVIVLEDSVSNEMVSTKLIIKSASGETISCSKPTPPLSSPRPYRSADKPIDVRTAKTIDPSKTLAIDIANILDYYQIKTPGTYTIQLVMFLDLHNKFVGREATAKDDIERQIRDINSKSNYTQQEKASLIQNLKEEMVQTSKRKAPRYIEVNAKGTPFKLESNTIEITIQ